MKNKEVENILENIKKMIMIQENEKAIEYIEYIKRKKIPDEKNTDINNYMNELIGNLK